LTLSLILLVSIVSSGVLALVPVSPPEPAYIESTGDGITVDGDPTDWDPTFPDSTDDDFFANMYNAGNADPDWPGYAILSYLYLRYDCRDNILYALVLDNTADAKMPDESPQDAWLKIYDAGWSNNKLIDGVGDGNTTPRGFEWVYDTPGDDTTALVGYEAYAQLDEGTWMFEAHLNVDGDTSSTGKDPIDLVIECHPTPVTLSSFAASARAGQVFLSWETAADVDIAGFNVYRARSENGAWAMINEALITAEDESALGASYGFADKPGYGTFLYALEEVNYDGVTKLHSAIRVVARPAFRRPLYRPRPPRSR
jgi:hypothetical protein